MYKSLLAISEGGPDAATTFGLAARIAGTFGGSVDAVHYAELRAGDFDIAAQSLPFVRQQFDDQLKSRALHSEKIYKELMAPLPGSTYRDGRDLGREGLIALGRAANLLVIGRPGDEVEDIAPDTVRTALYDCARPVLIAPPNLANQPIESVVVAWNGSLQAARALGYAMPFLEMARRVTVLTGGATPADVLRTLARHGIDVRTDTIPDGSFSARARGRALRNYARDKGADLLVMGAYGHGQLADLLGLGGATAKVISSCQIGRAHV